MSKPREKSRYSPCKNTPKLEFRSYISIEMLKSIAAQAFFKTRKAIFRRGEQSPGEICIKGKEDR